MKVLDLQCSHGHAFEGWFGSEDDFVDQCNRSLVQCPVCGDASVVKKLSAPRLNLSGRREEPQPKPQPTSQEVSVPASSEAQALTAAWLAMARKVVANTTDVGERFADEARKMHYGEIEERGIRGKTTLEEARELVEEGIDILPFALPEALKEPLQ